MIDDIRGACDLLLPVYQESDAVDGRVSLEVLPELATNTEKTVSEGVRLAKLVGRPNVMIKVPATPEGIPAIRALTAQGVSVNVTLIFSLLQYEEVLEAYLAGLEDRKAAGGDGAGRIFKGIASVASFFVSRVDAVCDKLLNEKAAATPAEAARCQVLRGKIGIANAKMAYDIYGAWSPRRAGRRWRLPARTRSGCSGPRPGPRIPSYPDTYYVDALMGRDTVDTVPPATLDAFIDHGDPAARLETDLPRAPSRRSPSSARWGSISAASATACSPTA